MSSNEVFADNCKMVKRYLLPLLYNLSPIYIDIDLVKTKTKKEYIVVTRQDGEEVQIEVTDKPAADIVKMVMDKLF